MDFGTDPRVVVGETRIGPRPDSLRVLDGLLEMRRDVATDLNTRESRGNDARTDERSAPERNGFATEGAATRYHRLNFSDVPR